jgi:hypothetical protein
MLLANHIKLGQPVILEVSFSRLHPDLDCRLLGERLKAVWPSE